VWAKTPLAELLNAFSAGFFIYEMIGLVSVCACRITSLLLLLLLLPPPPPPPPPLTLLLLQILDERAQGDATAVAPFARRLWLLLLHEGECHIQT
jgi:hypothetical protein